MRDIEKYGGYNKETGAYFTLVQSKDKKGNLIRTIEFVPLRLKDSLEKNEMAMKTYMADEHGLNEPEILLSKIQIDTSHSCFFIIADKDLGMGKAKLVFVDLHSGSDQFWIIGSC